jgi:hypothetical protein
MAASVSWKVPALEVLSDVLTVLRQEAAGRLCLWSRDDGGWSRGACVRSQDKLAVRGSTVYQHTGYQRKPAGTDTVRLNGMVKYRPFKNTTLSAAYESYRIHGIMPNQTLPRDTLTAWKAAGMPDSANAILASLKQKYPDNPGVQRAIDAMK